jgi:hypothetical protein
LKPFVTQVASSTPFDSSVNEFENDDVQRALEEAVRQKLARWRAVIPFAQVHAISNNGVLNLTSICCSLHWFEGTGNNYRINLPDASTAELNLKYEFWNMTDFVISVYNADNIFLFDLGQFSYALIQLQYDTTIAGTWRYWQILASSVASGIINYKVTSQILFSSSVTTDTLITGMSVTPQAGTYGVWFNANSTIVQNNQRLRISVYKDNMQLADSERTCQGTASNFDTIPTTMTVVQVNGSEVISARARVTGGSFSITGRTLILVRLGT